MHDNSFPGNAGYQPRIPEYQQDSYSWPGQQSPLGGLVNGPGAPQGGYSQGPNYGPNYGMPPAQPPARKRKRLGKRGAIIFAVGAFAFLVIVLVATGGSGSNGTAAVSSSVPAAVPSSSSAAAQAPSAPATSQAPAAPAMTADQQQAVDSAQSYLSEGQGFSEQGLVNQLTSSAGEGFTGSQAEYAISYLHPDWDAQAVDAAKGYLQLGGFSRASLIQQLTSSYGAGFTEAQAEYAANKVGM
jgi:Host cell surface-exposed lipoprotein